MTNNEALAYLMKLTNTYWYGKENKFYTYYERDTDEKEILSKLDELKILYYVIKTGLGMEKVTVNHMEVINHKVKVRDNKINSILDIE